MLRAIICLVLHMGDYTRRENPDGSVEDVCTKCGRVALWDPLF